MLKTILKFLLGLVLKLNYKKILYELYFEFIYPKLKSAVESTKTKFDNDALATINSLIYKYLNPKNKM